MFIITDVILTWALTTTMILIFLFRRLGRLQKQRRKM